MPLLPATAIPIIQSNLLSNNIKGIASIRLATALANGFCSYSQSIIVSTIDVGTIGSGSGIGLGVTLTPAQLIKTLFDSFTANGISGIFKQRLIVAIASSFSSLLTNAQILTANVGVGVGTGKATLIPNSALSISMMTTNFIAANLVGISGPKLARAVAQGYDLALPTAFGVVSITGGTGPSPGSGTGIGKLI